MSFATDRIISPPHPTGKRQIGAENHSTERAPRPTSDNPGCSAGAADPVTSDNVAATHSSSATWWPPSSRWRVPSRSVTWIDGTGTDGRSGSEDVGATTID